ncbi:MAG: 5-oxoprolinase subunit PxpB [Turicibacter sp.]|nr:5-oxoprolinase subunit PxpB [Turicibacter sp.]
MADIQFSPVGDSSVLLEFGHDISEETNAKITAFSKALKSMPTAGIIDQVPAFCSLLINYDPRLVTYATLVKKMKELSKTASQAAGAMGRVFEIPVCYDGECGPDLENIAKLSGLSAEEVIKIHSEPEYLIYMLGFMPGFPYLGGLDERIHVPRLEDPRLKIPQGSVGIGGAQTGIYPLESPGGWQLLGRTPVKTYEALRKPPILFEAGDYIKFVPITKEMFDKIENDAGYKCQVRRKEV